MSGVSTTVIPPKTRVSLLGMVSVVGDMSAPLDEGEQIRVDLILMCGGDAVWRARVVNVLRSLDEPSRLPGGVLHRNDLIVLTVKHQSRHIELLEVLGEVGLGEGLDALVGVLEAALHAPGPELVEHALRDLGAGPVGAIERNREIPVVLRAVLGQARTESVEQ